MERHWIYKVNGRRETGERWERDFFAKSDPEVRWGSKGLKKDEEQVLFRQLRLGDLVFAYQSDEKTIVGVFEITRVEKDDKNVTELFGRPVVQFRQSVPILQMKRIDSELSCIVAFQEGMGRGQLHPISNSSVETLIHACVRHNGGRYLGILPDEIIRGLDFGRAVETPKDAETDAKIAASQLTKFGADGEPAGHRKLKAYVHAHPESVKTPKTWARHQEYLFDTQDSVDVAFVSKDKRMATVVEVELEGFEETRVGLAQAIKYRAQMCSSLGLDLTTPMVRAFLVAHSIPPEVQKLGRASGVQCVEVDRKLL